jgi:hypothetical protein
MANDVKWTDWRSFETDEQQSTGAGTNPRTALLQLVGCVIGLSALTVVLPGPASWFGVLSGDPVVTPGLASIDAAAGTAILVTASVLVWLLLAWVLTVWFAAIAGRLPGAPGRCGRALLRRIAPAAAGRIVAAAVGVSLLAGTSACAVPAMGDLGSGANTPVVAGPTTTATPAPLGGGAGVVDTGGGTAAATPATTDPASLADILSSISIDWPAVDSPTSGADTPAPPTSGAAVDTPAPTDTTPADTTPAETTPETTAPETTTPETTTPTVAPTTSQVPEAITTSAATAAEPSTPAPESGPTDAEAPDAAPAPTTAAPPATTENDAAIPAPTAAAPPSTAGNDAPIPAPTSTPAQPGSGPTDADSAGAVVVLVGDTLWSIAHHHLNSDATDQEIDTAWRAWYSANTQVIGDNPDLIQPGQLLLPPDPEKGH